jgi:hypothetical protein
MNTIIRGVALAGGLVATFATVPAVAFLGAQEAGHESLTKISVDNMRDVPVVVYLDHGVFDTRVGTVQPNVTGVLALPKSLENGTVVQIFVHPEGGTDLASQEITVRKGETVDVIVPPNDVGYFPPTPVEIPDPGMKGATITVENARSQPVTIFVDKGDFDIRIGTVPANQTKTLAVPESVTRNDPDVEVFVHPEHGIDLGSQTLRMGPDAHLLVKVSAGQ